jgi:hypothetical protein
MTYAAGRSSATESGSDDADDEAAAKFPFEPP